MDTSSAVHHTTPTDATSTTLDAVNSRAVALIITLLVASCGGSSPSAVDSTGGGSPSPGPVPGPVPSSAGPYSNGFVISTIEDMTSGSDSVAYAQTFSYDPANRTINETRTHFAPNVVKKARYTVNENGNITAHNITRLNTGVVTTYQWSYDTTGRPVRITEEGAEGFQHQFSFDSNGHVTHRKLLPESPGRDTSYRYVRDQGRLVQITANGRVTDEIANDSSGRVVRQKLLTPLFGYGIEDNPLVAESTYDTNGNLSSIRFFDSNNVFLGTKKYTYIAMMGFPNLTQMYMALSTRHELIRIGIEGVAARY